MKSFSVISKQYLIQDSVFCPRHVINCDTRNGILQKLLGYHIHSLDCVAISIFSVYLPKNAHMKDNGF